MTEQQFGELIDTHAAALVLYARSWCASPDDFVQDAFCKLAEQRVPPVDPVAWLYRVVRNRALDVGKADRRRARREATAARPVQWFVEKSIDGLDAEVAVAALESLSNEYREVIVARLWGGLTFEQIALVLGCSVSSAHRRYEAGIHTLQERLGEPCQKNP